MENTDSSEFSAYQSARLLANGLLWFAVIAGLLLTSLHSYLLFHSLVEMFGVVVTCSIFMIAWNTRKFMDNNYLLFIGVASLFLGILATLHLLSYKGMGVFTGYDANLPTQLWIGSRYLLSVSLLVAPFLLDRKFHPRLTFAAYAGACTVLLFSIFSWENFPACFIEGQGLTTFKIASEYTVCFLLALSILALMHFKKKFDRKILRLLLAFISVSIIAEFMFTLYSTPFGFFNFLGHLLALVSYYFLYQALITSALRQPYNLLFRNLKQSEEALRESEGKYRLLSENLEEKVEEKVAELKLSQRLAGIGQVVSVVAHEVRNPLQNINLGIDAIRKEIGKNENIAEILEEIDYGINSLNTIVSELLEYSRPATLSITPWPVGNLIDRALDALDGRMQNTEVRLELEQELCEVPVDAHKMVRVLVNLFSNAVEAMEGAGTLRVQSCPCLLDAKKCVSLSIIDTGPGIGEKNLERIFEPFFTTKARGTGLGIPICKKIVEAHSGVISYRSRLNEGTTVEIVLPLE